MGLKVKNNSKALDIVLDLDRTILAAENIKITKQVHLLVSLVSWRKI